MKTISLAFLLALLMTSSVKAQSQKNSIDQLQQSVAEAYKAKTLRLLDSKKLINGSLLVVIEHSLAEGQELLQAGIVARKHEVRQSLSRGSDQRRGSRSFQLRTHFRRVW